MDRVQKSKLLLHKKAMEVSARVLGLEGWQGSGCGSQEPWTGTGLASGLHPATGTAACRVLGVALAPRVPCRLAQALTLGGS